MLGGNLAETVASIGMRLCCDCTVLVGRKDHVTVEQKTSCLCEELCRGSLIYVAAGNKDL